jgi:hypothetical protein
MPVLTLLQAEMPAILRLPTELRLAIYEECLPIERKHHTIVIKLIPSNISFQIVLQSTNVQLLATCKTFHREASAMFRRKLAEINSSPVRIIAATNAARSQFFLPGIMDALMKRIAQSSDSLKRGGKPRLPLLKDEDCWKPYRFAKDELLQLAAFVIQAALHHSFVSGLEPSVEIGYKCIRPWHVGSRTEAATAIIKTHGFSRATILRRGVHLRAKVLVALVECADRNRATEQIGSFVETLMTGASGLSHCDGLVDCDAFNEGWKEGPVKAIQ